MSMSIKEVANKLAVLSLSKDIAENEELQIFDTDGGVDLGVEDIFVEDGKVFLRTTAVAIKHKK